MWKCENCGEDVEDDFGVCWNCQTERGKAPPTDATAGPPAEPVGTSRVRRRAAPALSEQLEERYRDASRVARATIFFGGVAKTVASVFGIISVVLALVVYERSGALAVLGGLVGVFAGLLLHVAGVLVAAHGQLLLTSIDGVINSSPFLTDSERAAIMRVALDATGELGGNEAH